MDERASARLLQLLKTIEPQLRDRFNGTIILILIIFHIMISRTFLASCASRGRERGSHPAQCRFKPVASSSFD